MKTFVRLIRRYVLAAGGIVLLLLFSGVAVLGWLAGKLPPAAAGVFLQRDCGFHGGDR